MAPHHGVLGIFGLLGRRGFKSCPKFFSLSTFMTWKFDLKLWFFTSRFSKSAIFQFFQNGKSSLQQIGATQRISGSPYVWGFVVDLRFIFYKTQNFFLKKSAILGFLKKLFPSALSDRESRSESLGESLCDFFQIETHLLTLKFHLMQPVWVGSVDYNYMYVCFTLVFPCNSKQTPRASLVNVIKNLIVDEQLKCRLAYVWVSELNRYVGKRCVGEKKCGEKISVVMGGRERV